MSIRRIEDTDPLAVGPVARQAGTHDEREAATAHLADGTIACPRCDAPVALGVRTRSPSDPLACPYCAHAGAVRDFLALGSPSRPARVRVRVVAGPRARGLRAEHG